MASAFLVNDFFPETDEEDTMNCVNNKPVEDAQRGVLALLFEFLELVSKIVFACLESAYRCIVPESKSLVGEVVLITGAARGLGRELALTFAEERAVLVLWDVDEKGVQSVKSEIEALGGRAHAYRCDVSDIEEVNRTGTLVQENVGDVTIVVNNAGVLQNVLFTELDVRKIRKTIDVNLLAHFWINKFFLPKMIEMKKGHIVAISSVGGLEGWRYLADYSASKFGVIGMMEVLELEMKILGLAEEIHFTTACPVTIDTGMCQRPTTRFPFFLPVLNVKETARTIIDAVQRNERIIAIPKTLLSTLLVLRLFPKKVAHLVFEYIRYNMNPNKVEKKI